MKSLLLIIMACLSLFASDFDTDENPIDSICESCIEENPHTQGVIVCYANAAAAWDSLLNAEYSSVMLQLNSEQQGKLREAQRSWISFRDDMFTSFYYIYGKNSGTLWKVIIAQEKMELIKAQALRISHLEVESDEEVQ